MSIEKWAIILVAVVIAVLLGIAVMNAENRADYPIERNDRDVIEEGREIDFDEARDWGYRTPAERKKAEVASVVKEKDAPVAKPAARKKTAATTPGTTLVRRGETYSHIARRVYGKAKLYPLLMKANPKKSARALRAGDEIVVPPLEGAGAALSATRGKSTTSAKEQDNGRRTHRVRSGETFTALAARYYRDSGRWREIADANPEVGGPRGLRPGQELVIP